jgi:hypothetical protein
MVLKRRRKLPQAMVPRHLAMVKRKKKLLPAMVNKVEEKSVEKNL